MREITRDVWSTNLEEAMRDLRRLVESYPYIAIDCEFPAVVARPIGKFKTSTDYHYQTMRCNVEILKLIQLGITLVNEEGQVAQDITWQFNFYFNTDEDTYEPASIDALAKAGLDFARHRSHGIRPFDFAELMITSGLVLLEGVTWISYHGAYDFAFLLRTLTNIPLPLSEEEFFTSLRIWFPQLYDIKYIMRQIKPSLKGGLVEVANDLGVGGLPQPPHTSGTTSYLLATTYHTLLDHYITPATTRWDISSFQGALYGLGSTYVSGVLDNSRTTLTSAERERPGQNGHATSSSMGSTSGVSGMGVGMGVGVGVGMGVGQGMMSPSQVSMHTGQPQHLGALGASATAQHYAQIQLAAAAAAAGGHGHMGSVLPMHHPHQQLHHGHHHGHGQNLGPLGALGGHPLGIGAQAGTAAQGTGTGGTNASTGQGGAQTPGSQSVYGIVQSGYAPYMGGMNVGSLGSLSSMQGYAGMPGVNPYFGRDR